MNQIPLLQSRTVQVAGPALALLVLYFALFHLSITKQSKLESAKLAKLESAVKLADVNSANQQLAALQSETAELNERLQSIKQNHQLLVARQSPANGNSEKSASPAKTIADVVELLQHEGLTCVSSSLVASGRSMQNDPTQGNPSTLQRSRETDGREIQLGVTGSFDQMRSALSQLRLKPHIWLRSLEMDESDGLSSTRSWTLTIDAKEAAR